MKFKELLVEKDGILKGPFGGDVKKALFVPKGENTYKVFEQSVVVDQDFSKGNYYLPAEYVEKKLSKFFIKEGDFLITGAGTLGLIIEVPRGIEKGIINQALIRLRLNNSVINKDYFRYYFSSSIKNIACKLNGDSVIPNLPPIKILKEIDINIPSMDEQKNIGTFLNQIDLKIQNNKKQIETLESLAKTIYDYWFEQFDFPNDEGKPYKSSGGKMVWNEELKREIPEKWEVNSISDFNCYTSDFTANGSFAGLAENVVYSNDRNYARLIRIVDFNNNFSSEKSLFIDKKGYDYLSSCQLFGGEIIICNVGNAGAIFRCPFLNEKMALGPNGIVLKKYNYDNFLYMYFFSDVGQRQIRSICSGSIQLKFNKTNFRKIKLFLPPIKIINRYNDIYNKNKDKKNTLWRETRELEKLKEFLMPLLMNGQVSIG